MNKYSNNMFFIAGFGNPLLDICVNIKDVSLLEKFNLEPDGQKEIGEVQMKDLIDCVYSDQKKKVTFHAGGSAQNTLRILQHLIKTPSFTIFFGSCGKDDKCKILQSIVQQACVECRYATKIGKATGTVISLISGSNRSLVAHLGAANFYSLEDLKSHDNLDIIKYVSFVYIEGFFLSHSFNVALEIIKICRQQGNVVVFNLSGAYLFANHSQELATVTLLADIIIGNQSEFLALANFLKIHHLSMKEILLFITSLDFKMFELDVDEFSHKAPYKHSEMLEFQQILVCTDGNNPILAVYKKSEFISFPVKYMDSSMIIDTTGAGDAFSAGFIAGFIMINPIKECLSRGCEIAQKVIQSIGCNISETH